MTRAQRHALTLAQTGHLTEHRAAHATINVLWTRGLITFRHPKTGVFRDGRAWLTAEGLIALRPPPPNHDATRFLTPAARPAGSTLGYTTSILKAMRGAGPVPNIPPHPEWGRGAGHRHRSARQQAQASREQARELLTLEDRMTQAQAQARAQHVDVTAETWLLKRMLNQGRTRTALCRLTLIEQRLDQAA